MLVALCSLKGSPGATTTAVALAARWPAGQNPVVVECDPAGGDLAARFRLPATPGLVSLAAAARRNTDPGVLWQHCQRLPAALALVPGAIGAEQARAALGIVAARRASVLRAAADQPNTAVIVDCGRVDPDSPVLPLIRAADAMLLLAHAHDDELSHVAGKLRTAATWNPNPGFVLVGGGYSTAEVERELRISVLGRIPDDPKGAAVLCGRRRTGPGPHRSALGRAAMGLARSITANAGRNHTTDASAPAEHDSAPAATDSHTQHQTDRSNTAITVPPLSGPPTNGMNP